MRSAGGRAQEIAASADATAAAASTDKQCASHTLVHTHRYAVWMTKKVREEGEPGFRFHSLFSRRFFASLMCAAVAPVLFSRSLALSSSSPPSTFDCTRFYFLLRFSLPVLSLQTDSHFGDEMRECVAHVGLQGNDGKKRGWQAGVCVCDERQKRSTIYHPVLRREARRGKLTHSSGPSILFSCRAFSSCVAVSRD